MPAIASRSTRSFRATDRALLRFRASAVGNEWPGRFPKKMSDVSKNNSHICIYCNYINIRRPRPTQGGARQGREVVNTKTIHNNNKNKNKNKNNKNKIKNKNKNKNNNNNKNKNKNKNNNNNSSSSRWADGRLKKRKRLEKKQKHFF